MLAAVNVADARPDDSATAGNERRALPASESDPRIAQLAREWTLCGAAFGEFSSWASHEGLPLATARCRAVWCGSQIVARHEQHAEQFVRIGRHWITDARGRRRRIVPTRDLTDAQWRRWWRARARAWARFFFAGGTLPTADTDPLNRDPLDETSESMDATMDPSDWNIIDVDQLFAEATDDERSVLKAFVCLVGAAGRDGWPSWRAIDRHLGFAEGRSRRLVAALKQRVCTAASA